MLCKQDWSKFSLD